MSWPQDLPAPEPSDLCCPQQASVQQRQDTQPGGTAQHPLWASTASAAGDTKQTPSLSTRSQDQEMGKLNADHTETLQSGLCRQGHEVGRWGRTHRHTRCRSGGICSTDSSGAAPVCRAMFQVM